MDVICNIDVNYKNMGSSLNNIEENMNIIIAKLSNDKEMLGKEEIKTLKAELKKLEKDKKAVINKLKEPKSILDYINKCFAEKK